MKYLFCSSVHNMADYPHLCERSKISLSLADHNLNFNIVIGLGQVLGKPIKLINNAPIPTYPKYPKIWFRKHRWSHTEGADDIHCGFINLPIIKHLSRACTTFRALRREIKAADNEPVCVLTYDIHPSTAVAIKLAKMLYKKIITCAVLPDIPNAVLLASSGGKLNRSTKFKAAIKTFFIKQFDSYVFLTEHMKQAVDVTDKAYTVMEGIYNSAQPALEDKTTEQKIILYSGQLNPAYGMENLIEAFLRINREHSDYRLWLCGGGKLVEHIKRLALQFPAIEYFGYVGPDKVRECQRQATVLINPRQNTDQFTKFSFPSKTMEYLASGRLVVGYKLDGIPAEYDEHIIYVPDNSVQTLCDTLIEVCSWDAEKQRQKGQAARSFILQNKNPEKQCQRIVQMLQTLSKSL